ncbi:MAG: hypothetical protein HY926_11315 [Elusimicrobia bacterium]|nr:hypothetical protein [Elusimicrobiota bacterium]
MKKLLLAAALAVPVRGQEASTPTVSASTAAVAASTPMAAAPQTSEAPAVPRSRVVVHKDAADWEPVSVRLKPAAGGRTAFESQIRKVAGRYQGRKSPAKAAARVHPAGEDQWLVVCVHPAALRSQRIHLEARFLVQEGFLEKVELAKVMILGGEWSAQDEKEDSFTLRAKGVDFNEQTPAGAEVELSAIDPGPGPKAVNAGSVRHAAFGGRDLGFVDLSWSVTGVAGDKPRQAAAAKPAKKK